MKIYNTMTQKKEELIPIQKDVVRIYNCGPTVYYYNHIGNFRSYIFVDILRRYLKFRGYKVQHTSNITDIDDKIIQNAIQENKTIEEFTKPYIGAFLEDLKTLNIEPVEHRPFATHYIPQMFELIRELERNGHIYVMDGNVYFKISTFPEYGNLSHLDKKQLLAGASQRFDVDEYTKEDVRDFALWKKPVLPHEPKWQSPWGEGRPGWHIECSAMIRGIYGKEGIDIHIGGVDLVFPHHENEIAQNKGAYPDDNFVKYWMHNEHLLVNGKKMSKSLGNYYTLRELIDYSEAQRLVKENRAPEFILEFIKQGKMGKILRFVLLSTHYRQKLNFTFEQLQLANQNIEKIQNAIYEAIRILSNEFNENYFKDEIQKDYESRFHADTNPPGQKNQYLIKKDSVFYPVLEKFIEAMDDDLNISVAFASVHELVSLIHQVMEEVFLKNKKTETIKDSLKQALLLFYAFNLIFGVFSFNSESDSQLSPDEIQWIEARISERSIARKNKDFKKADEIRNELENKGIILIDTPTGTKWQRKSISLKK